MTLHVLSGVLDPWVLGTQVGYSVFLYLSPAEDLW